MSSYLFEGTYARRHLHQRPDATESYSSTTMATDSMNASRRVRGSPRTPALGRTDPRRQSRCLGAQISRSWAFQADRRRARSPARTSSLRRAAHVVFGNTGYLVAEIGDFMEPHLRAEMDRRADTFDPMLERPDPQATTDVA